MAKQAGCDVLIKVANASGLIGTYKTIGGQTGATLNRSAETVDVTDKTNSGWKESMAGLKEWSLDCDGFIVIDDTGIAVLDECFENRKPLFITVDFGGKRYQGSGYITDYPVEMPLDGAVSYSFSISGASPLTKGAIGD